MKRKKQMYFYDPNNKDLGELACWCWHEEINDPKATMTLRRYLPNSETQIFASFGYWDWTNGIEPREITEKEFMENVRKFLPNAKAPLRR